VSALTGYLVPMPGRPWSLVVPALLAACGGEGGGSRAACGLAAVAGPTALLTQFGIPNQTLSEPPRRLPERLVVRVVAGDAYPAVVGRTDSLLVVGVEGSLPAKAHPGFGVLVVDPQERTRGVMLYEGDPVEGAPRLGNVSVGGATVPLIGIQLDPVKVEDANCPLFPDSLAR
jgi:hypothetical protein